MNRRLHAILRRIEKSIEQIDIPKYEGMTISPTAKTWELEMLVKKLAEAQKLVDDDSSQEWLNGVKQTLKSRLEQVFNPIIIVGDGDPSSPATFL